MRNTFTVIDPNSKIMENYNDEFGSIDVHLPPPQKESTYKKIRSIAITTTLIVLILISIFILLIKHHPQMRIWGSDKEQNSAEGLFSKDTSSNTTVAILKNSKYKKLSIINEIPKFERKTTDALYREKKIQNTNKHEPMEYLIEPMHYDIYVRFNWNPYEEHSFKGNVSIILHTQEPTHHIVIGASDLRITSVRLRPSQLKQPVEEIFEIAIDSYNIDDGLLVLQTDRVLQPLIQYILNIEYYGDLQRMSYGLFRLPNSSSEEATDSVFIASNTETPFARTIFPCFDLTTQFASFKLNVCRDGSMRTSATTGIVSQKDEGQHKCIWDHFATSIPIPTRLFGFVTSNYIPEERILKDNLHLTVWTSTKRTKEVAYLFDILPRMVAFFEDYFGVPMPTTHIDYYGVPEIMPYITSKIGIIIVPETDMLVKENETNEDQKERVAKVAATHIAEQWVEYMVQLRGEQDDWIKDSLVQYLQYSAIDSIHPKWKIFDEFFTIVLQNEMDAEIVNPTEKTLNVVWMPYSKLMHKRHALYPLSETTIFKDLDYHSQVLYSPDSQREVNPTIYSELFVERHINMGVCLFRMLEHILTENVFRNSIKKFLEQGTMNRMRAGKVESLWSIMTAETSKANDTGEQRLPTHLTLEGIVNEWLFLYDFPILKVARKYDGDEISFIQFLDVQEFAAAHRVRTYRHLPISYTMESEKFFAATTAKLWLKSSKLTTMPNPAGLTNDTWFLVNLQQSGLYRVSYDDENWRMLKHGLERGDFPANIRAQLIDDALFLGRRGYMNYEFALNMTHSLSIYGERDFIVWNTVLRHFAYVETIMGSIDDKSLEKPRSMLKEYIRVLINPVYEAIFVDKTAPPHDPHDHSFLLLRALIFDWACKMGTESCQVVAKSDFNAWRQNENPDEENPIIPHMRYAVLCNAMRYGDSADFEFLFNRYMNSSSIDTNRPTYLRSMYCFNQINYTLPSILSETLLNDRSLAHLHDVNDIWQVLIETPITSTIPLDYLLTYWKSILKKFSDFAPILKNIVEGATANVSKEDQLNALFRLRQDIEHTPNLKDIFQDVIKHIKYRINWKYQEFNIFVSWLQKVTTNEAQYVKGNSTP